MAARITQESLRFTRWLQFSTGTVMLLPFLLPSSKSGGTAISYTDNISSLADSLLDDDSLSSASSSGSSSSSVELEVSTSTASVGRTRR